MQEIETIRRLDKTYMFIQSFDETSPCGMPVPQADGGGPRHPRVYYQV